MPRDITGLEYDKFTTDGDGQEAVRVIPVTGDNGQMGMDISTLRYNAFTTDDDGKVAIRTVTTDTGVVIFEVQFFVDTADGTRIGWVVDGNDLTLLITHSLNTANIIVEFYEDGLNGTVDVPWTTQGVNEITACIPGGSAFNGVVRILSRALPSSNVDSAGYSEEFTISKFLKLSNSDLYRATFLHGLGTNILDYSFYLDNTCPNLICASRITTSTLEIEVTEPERFGGSVIIEKTS